LSRLWLLVERLSVDDVAHRRAPSPSFDADFFGEVLREMPAVGRRAVRVVEPHGVGDGIDPIGKLRSSCGRAPKLQADREVVPAVMVNRTSPLPRSRCRP